jgi:predicted 3-demethylubiquinone-9 3-methyltransferase (glyoxalase superfamily)
MPKITSCLWFDGSAEDAAGFYTAVFPDSKIDTTARVTESVAAASGLPEGSVLTITFRLADHHFMALNGGPEFKFTPANSFFVSCSSSDEIDELWEKLSEGGSVLIAMDRYPWAERYGWCQDKFGLTWQLILAKSEAKIAPSLLFVDDLSGKADEAIHFYISQFDNSQIVHIERYSAGEPGQEGSVKFAGFNLDGQQFTSMDAPGKHGFTFSPAVSFMVNCKDQTEVDRFWSSLSDGGAKGRCGWLTDRFGVSWQIVPSKFIELIKTNDSNKMESMMKAMMPMTKLDMQKLQTAFDEA